MRHRILTCRSHPQLRWSCKDVAWSGGGYNYARSLFFKGAPTGKGMYSDGSGLDCTQVVDGRVVDECSCPAADLVLAPEDALVAR